MEEKDCAFQYATSYNYASTKFYEDTPLITLNEAKALWHKYLPQFIKELQDDVSSPEMAIWINMNSEGDYRQALAHVDSATETDGKRLYETKREYINVDKPTEETN